MTRSKNIVAADVESLPLSRGNEQRLIHPHFVAPFPLPGGSGDRFRSPVLYKTTHDTDQGLHFGGQNRLCPPSVSSKPDSPRRAFLFAQVHFNLFLCH